MRKITCIVFAACIAYILYAGPFVMNGNNGRYLGNTHLSYPSLSTVFYNPSIMPSVNATGVSFIHNRMFADVYQTGLAVAFKLNSGGYVSIGFQEMTAPDQEVYNDYGLDPDGYYSFYYRNFFAGYTFIIQSIAISGTLHYQDERLWTIRSGFPYVNVNVSLHHESMIVSLAALNLGFKHTYIDDAIAEPIHLMAGVGYRSKNHYVITEAFYKGKDEYSLSFGHEIGVGEFIGFGYGAEVYKDNVGDWYFYPTFGGRVGTPLLTFDYSLIYKSELMISHQFGLTVNF